MSNTIKETEMNELLDEANEMSLGEEAGAGIINNALLTKALKCGTVLTVSAECSIARRSCGIIRK